VVEARPAAFLDTSVIVRYLMSDPPDLAARAASVIDGEETLILSAVALVETAYVLTTVYEAPRDVVVEALASFVQRRNVRLLWLPKTLVLEALSLCAGSKRHSFADALLWAEARHAGAGVFTFDRRFPSLGITTGPPGA
jgi:predicted nucleic acid-binding protein